MRTCRRFQRFDRSVNGYFCFIIIAPTVLCTTNGIYSIKIVSVTDGDKLRKPGITGKHCSCETCFEYHSHVHPYLFTTRKNDQILDNTDIFAEKKETPFYQITKLHDLTRRIAELTEEIEELILFPD